VLLAQFWEGAITEVQRGFGDQSNRSFPYCLVPKKQKIQEFNYLVSKMD
jgi:hypothetical protein